MAAANAYNLGYEIKSFLYSLLPGLPLCHELIVDSNSLFRRIPTIHQGDDDRIRGIVARMRNLFESKERNLMRWIPGIQNVADTFAKCNVKPSSMLNELLAVGVWCVNTSDRSYLDSEFWC